MKRAVCVVFGVSLHSVLMAGYYQVTYPLPWQAPYATIVGPSGNPWTSPYTFDAFWGRYGGSWASQDQPYPPFMTPVGEGSVDADQTITITFTWIETDGDSDDTPPPYVLIIKDSAASWSGNSGSCANGLGDAPNNGEYSGSSAGVHYELYANPPESFTRQITPVVHAVATTPLLGPECATGSISVKYNAVPIEIKLTGVLHPDKDRRLMIGQNLGAYVSIGGMTLGNSPTYSWNVSGGNPFQSWNVNVTSGAPDEATVTPFTAQTTATLSTYLRTPTDPGDFTVSCTFYWPWMNQTLNLTEKGKSVKPTTGDLGAEMTDPEMLPGSSNPSAVRLSDNSAGQPGIRLVAHIDTPDDFDNDGNGWWTIVQMVTPYREVDGTHPCDNRYASHPNGHFWVNSRYGLDTSFPYPTPMAILYDFSHSHEWPADGTENAAEDSPGQATDNDPSSAYHRTHASDSFNSYYVYFPPGNSQYVPIKRVDWYWTGTIRHESGAGSWVWDAQEKGWSFNGDFPLHPTWTYRHMAGANWTFH